jgi:hypothetical protein
MTKISSLVFAAGSEFSMVEKDGVLVVTFPSKTEKPKKIKIKQKKQQFLRD